MDEKAGIKRPLESPVPREEIEEDVSSIERHRSLDNNDLSDVADNNKVEKNRERNREHAKRTRQRKKEMMEGMKIRLLELQREVPPSLRTIFPKLKNSIFSRSLCS